MQAAKTYIQVDKCHTSDCLQVADMKNSFPKESTSSQILHLS